jgi:hypothetical protein
MFVEGLKYGIFLCFQHYASEQRTGSYAVVSPSMANALVPLSTMNSPLSPQVAPYEFLTIQYFNSVYGSVPHPMITTE